MWFNKGHIILTSFLFSQPYLYLSQINLTLSVSLCLSVSCILNLMCCIFPSYTSLSPLFCKSILGLRLLCLAGIALFDSIPTTTLYVCVIAPTTAQQPSQISNFFVGFWFKLSYAAAYNGTIYTHARTHAQLHAHTHALRVVCAQGFE